MQAKDRITISITPEHNKVLNKWRSANPQLSRSYIVELLIEELCEHKLIRNSWRYEFAKESE